MKALLSGILYVRTCGELICCDVAAKQAISLNLDG
jgi:hypothetical protein